MPREPDVGRVSRRLGQFRTRDPELGRVEPERGCLEQGQVYAT